VDENDKDPLSEYANWKERSEGEEQTQDPKELFKQVTHVSLCISYDMIDKIRFWEKETLKLSDEEIAKRIPHMAASLETLRTAYLQFSDVDF
jgi:hypothetical protein